MFRVSFAIRRLIKKRSGGGGAEIRPGTRSRWMMDCRSRILGLYHYISPQLFTLSLFSISVFASDLLKKTSRGKVRLSSVSCQI